MAGIVTQANDFQNVVRAGSHLFEPPRCLGSAAKRYFNRTATYVGRGSSTVHPFVAASLVTVVFHTVTSDDLTKFAHNLTAGTL